MSNNNKTTLKNKIDKYFQISERGSNFKSEIIGGLANFMVICYVMVLIPSQISNASSGMFWNAMFFATILSTVIATVLVAFTGNIPMIYAPSLGISAYMASLIYETGIYTYGQCLVMILLAGIIFVVLSLTDARDKILDAIPKCVKDAIGVGIGVFIAYIGFSNSGLLTFLTTGPMGSDGTTNLWVPALVALISFFTIIILQQKNIKGSVLYGILVGTVCYLFLQFLVLGQNPFEPLLKGRWLPPVKDFWEQCIQNGLIQGFKDFGNDIGTNWLSTIVGIVLMVLNFVLINIFNTVGTILGTCKHGNLLQKDGYPPRFKQIMISSSSATALSGIIGCPTCNAYVESASGIESGAKTGLSSLVTCFLFLACLFISPIANLIPSCAVNAALLYVGVLMFTNVIDIDYSSIETAVPVFLTIMLMPFTQNIAYGIAGGLLAHVIIQLFKGNGKKISVFAYICVILFIIFFATQNLFA